ncbi:chemotaxis protein CheB [Alteriqipengyuania lutimaris]|uniref:protein-glutamate methylesterase n=1 Tax=Alteriqipengyuania lutimaris TaxID=1538146 RepID=A0A395LI52_9SPHN|nr:chemotaxis protein CheB [Alteriqipengyuania lutimaris]MBB3034824.1 two-component system chemotaxis response regulator CheB [Alteriqipengyuania lutimaris]RDS76335.1 chemotaxis protein CheB [Alteriqipengyuania lutimaris]
MGDGDHRRDLIGIGGSAGGLPALLELLDSFRPQEPASLFVVLHRAKEAGHLFEILRRRSPIDVIEPEDGTPIRHGCLHLAPPDAHMLIGDDHVHLRRGPKENNFRPAIDPLFRSLAVFGGSRATAVILSGYLDDGAAGSRAIARVGGGVIVQDPNDATSPNMPRAAISAVGEPETIASARAIGEALSGIVAQPAGPAHDAPQSVRVEMMIAGLEKASMTSEDRLGELSPYNCPDCNGVLWRIEDGPLSRFRCHTGHAYTQSALAERQDELLEQSMYDTLRSLREKARMMRDLAERDDINRKTYLQRATDADTDAANVEQLILTRGRRAS